MKRLKKWLARMMGGRRQTGRWVMNVPEKIQPNEFYALLQFLQKNTPIITAAQYNRLPDECKKLFIKVGAK